MQWNDHSNLEGKHSIMSPSNHSWKNYDDAKLISWFESNKRKAEGTALHKWAEETITSINLVKELAELMHKRMIKIDISGIRELGEKDPFVRESKAKETVYMYVADAIKFGMIAEQPLLYSKYCFGTADAIQFDGALLRVHDLKTGETPASIDQLIIYAALFCLEYNQDPSQLIFELRIYQTDQVMIYNPTTDEIVDMINRIVHMVDVLQRYERGEL